MIFRIEIKQKKQNNEAELLKAQVKELGYPQIKSIIIFKVFLIKGDLSKKEVKKIALQYLIDPVIETFRIGEFFYPGSKKIEIGYNLGVTDPQEEQVIKTLTDAGFNGLEVKILKKYLFFGEIEEESLVELAQKLLYNPLIQHIISQKEDLFRIPPAYQFRLKTIPVLNKSKKELEKISQRHGLALSMAEMLAIQNYYRKLKREPTDIELETFAQTWSEHCRHKTIRGNVYYKKKWVRDLLAATIFKVTKELKKPYCLSVFKDNSGVIEFNETYGISFKVETHNHPSAIEPYGGAATGIGGVIRDCLGTGLGAKPILNTDIFCFAHPKTKEKSIPKGVIHPKRILKGVVSGVRDYGNRMGIPTANGALYFHPKFIANPLVFCGTVGLIPKDKIEKKIVSGDLIVLVGGDTGRDGIHGVTFASGELKRETAKVAQAAVQIGNPIEEKKLCDALLQARDENLFNAITDCGGGGLSSAIGELAAPCGAVVDLDKVPLKYTGLSYTEIWISESQERMIIFLPEENFERFKEICAAHNVKATIIGQLTNDKKLTLRYKGNLVGEVDLNFLHKKIPKIKRKAKVVRKEKLNYHLPLIKDYNEILLKIMSSENVASREWIIRQYDFEVQGRTILKPLLGMNTSPSDAVVLKPLPEEKKGIAVACGLNPSYGEINPYWMAASVVDEALRNCVAVGGDINHTAVLDNFCFGNPEKEVVMGELTEACFGAYFAAKGYSVPFISGKDSLYNEFVKKKKSISIPPTLLISAISLIPDIEKIITPYFKTPNSVIFIIGETFEELGGSVYFNLKKIKAGKVPRVKPEVGRKMFEKIFLAIQKDLILSLHDISDGGLAVALCEMTFTNNLGFEIFLDRVVLGEKITRPDYILFSESNTRFIAEIPKEKINEFLSLMQPIKISQIGEVRADDKVIMKFSQKTLIDLSVSILKERWQKGLSELLT